MKKKRTKKLSTICPAPTPGNVPERPALPFLCSSLSGLSIADEMILTWTLQQPLVGSGDSTGPPSLELSDMQVWPLQALQWLHIFYVGLEILTECPWPRLPTPLLRNPFLPRPVSFTDTTCPTLARDGTQTNGEQVFRKASLKEGMNDLHNFYFNREGHIRCTRGRQRNWTNT